MAKLTTAQQIAKKRQELADLEARWLDGLKVGTVIRTVADGEHTDIPVGSLAKITEIDYDGKTIRAWLLDDSDWDRFAVGEFEVPSRDEVREILIAGIDKQLDGLFA